MNVIAADEFTGRRLRARRVDEDYFARWTAERAEEVSDWVFDVNHGGDVCNSYGYRAETECVLAVSDPFGNVVFWVGRADANKITKRKAAEACLPGAGDLFDERVKSDDRKETARRLLIQEHETYFPAMMVIASAASE